MELDGANLSDRGEAFFAIDLQLGLAVAEDGHQLQEMGCAGHGVSLKELLSANPIGGSDYRAQSPFDMINQPRTDRLVIVG
jgi:hypothetical protein